LLGVIYSTQHEYVEPEALISSDLL